VASNFWILLLKFQIQTLQQWLAVQLDELLPDVPVHLRNVPGVRPEAVVHSRKRQPALVARHRLGFRV